MASFFVVGAAISIASHEQSWSRVAWGDASPLDWLHAITTTVTILSGVVFALGHFTVSIATAWIWYCVIEALVAYPFWTVAPAAVADCATAFLSRFAVAASLMLYIAHAETVRR